MGIEETPKGVWFFKMLELAENEPENLPDNLPEWFFKTLENLEKINHKKE